MRRFPRAFYVLVPLLTAVVVLLLVEAGLTFFYPVPFTIDRNMVYVADPVLGYRPKPGSEGYYRGGIPARANKHGHRDDPVDLAKPSGVFRILVLGDSFTVGASVEQAQAWPQMLERLLNESSSQPVEVVNAAVGGWEPLQYLLYFQNEGIAFEPDLVVAAFFVGNDTFDRTTSSDRLMTAVGGRRVQRETAAKPFIHARVWLYDHSHLVRLLRHPDAPRDKHRRQRRCDAFSEGRLALERQLFDNHLRESADQIDRASASIEQISALGNAARATGAAFVTVLIPAEAQVNPFLQEILLAEHNPDDYDFDMPQPMLKVRWAETGIQVVDLLEVFRNDPRCLYLNDTHWTSEGHALAATVVARQLKP